MACALTLRPLAAICAALVAAAGCSDSLVLAERIDEAGAFTETATVDVGSPDARPHLLEGWSPFDERWLARDDETFVWGLADGTVFEAWLLQAAPRTMTMRFRPFAPDDVALFSSLHVTINGGPLPPLEVTMGWQEVEVTIPERFQVVGPNRVAFGFDAAPGPAAAESNPEAYRIAIDWIHISETLPTALPRRPLDSRREILLPYLSALDYQLTLRPGSELWLGQVRRYGRPFEEEAHLLVRLETPEGASYVVVPVPVGAFTTPAPIPVPLRQESTVRLTLMAVPAPSYRLLLGHEAEQDAGLGLVDASVTGGR